MTAAQDWATTTEDAVLTAAVRLAPKLGWGQRLFQEAAKAVGLSLGEAELLLPHGAADLAALFSARHDAAALAALPAEPPAKIRERIRAAVLARLDAAAADREAVRRCTGFLALPSHIPLATRLAWRSADAIWRWAGDTATDENHYTKRALLAGILTSCLALELSHGRAAALANLDRRIDNVMAFERWKAGLHPAAAAESLAGLLSRLRYGRPS